MDGAEAGDNGVDCLLYGLLVTDVGLHEHRALRPEVRHGFFAGLSVEIEDSDAGALLLQQILSRCSAEAGSTTGNDDDFVLNAHNVSCLIFERVIERDQNALIPVSARPIISCCICVVPSGIGTTMASRASFSTRNSVVTPL